MLYLIIYSYREIIFGHVHHNLLQIKTKQCPEERYDDTRAEKIRTQSEAFNAVRNVILNFVHRNLQF